MEEANEHVTRWLADSLTRWLADSNLRYDW